MDGRNPKAGQTLYLFTGMRTKNCQRLGEVICKKSETITIEDHAVVVGCHALTTAQENYLAKQDGFESFIEFKDFFINEYGLPFFGFLIEW